jgi:hypothetical protein
LLAPGLPWLELCSLPGELCSFARGELQIITGHARRKTLAVYQHVALDGDLEQKYQEAIRKVDL